MRTAYYPGCSLESSSEGYDASTRAVFGRLGVELVEIDDWNCCGAAEMATFDAIAAHALVARNLARVPPELDDVVAPCAACYLNLRRTDEALRDEPGIREPVLDALSAGGLSYRPGRVAVRHVLDVLHEDVGEERLRAAVVRPLAGLRVAPYYGCQVVRPRREGGDDPEQPVRMDEVLRWVGATVVDFPLRAHCCGGHLSQVTEEQSNELLRRLLANADRYHADVIACICPMCQLNLDAYQGRVNNAFNTNYRVPAVFLTQLVGLALGIDADALGLGREIVDARGPIERRLAEGPPERPPRPKRDRHALPMPG